MLPHISLTLTPICSSENYGGYFKLQKTIPSDSPRYGRTKSFLRCPVSFFVSSTASKPIINGDLTLKRSDSVTAAGWVVYIHPEGLRYYYHPVRRVVTDANLTDNETLAKICTWVDEFYQVTKERAFVLPSSFELLLELDIDDQDGKYYIIDHDKQSVFYFDEVNTEDVGLPDVYSEDHLKLQLEGQYWNHIESFPMHHPLPSFADKMIMDILNHAWADRATSTLSTSPFSAEDCKEFIANLKSYSGESGKEGYHAWMVARLLKCFIFARFINRFGEVQGARLSRNQSLEATTQKSPSLLFGLISRVLFRQPGNDLNELNVLWVDNIVYAEHWRAFNTAKVEEYYGVCAMASMLLVASRIIDPTTSPQSVELAVQISQYGASACQLLSLSALILGFQRLLIHKPFREVSVCEAGDYLTSSDHGKHGLQNLAIALSLPRALLMWGLAAMVLSLVSINAEYFAVCRAIVPNTFMVSLAAIVMWAMRN